MENPRRYFLLPYPKHWKLGQAFLAIVCNPVLSRSVVSDTVWPHGLQPASFLCPWDSPGKNIGVGSHSLLQGIFPTQGSNPGLLYCRWILYCVSHHINCICLCSFFFFLPSDYSGVGESKELTREDFTQRAPECLIGSENRTSKTLCKANIQVSLW